MSAQIAAPHSGMAASPVKRMPLRTCVACRTTGGKRGLLRVVRLPDGASIAVDKTGKANGRGAYICPTGECLGIALKRKALERSLKTPLTESVIAELSALVQSEGLPIS